MDKRLLTEQEVLDQVGCGKTYFDETYVKTGRFKWVYLSERMKRGVDTEVAALVEEIINERGTTPKPVREQIALARKRKTKAA